MTTDESESLNLVEVTQRFSAAELHLTELAEAARTLRTESDQLDQAKDAVQTSASSLADLASTLEGLVSEIKTATEAIQRTDPAAIVHRLEAIDSRLEEAEGQLTGIDAGLSSTREQLAQETRKIRAISLSAAIAAIVAAVLSGITIAL